MRVARIPWHLLIALAMPVSADTPPGVAYGNPTQIARQGDITLHFMALPSALVPPDVARRNGITRSSNRALLNLSLRQGAATRSSAISAPMQVTARNSAGLVQRLQLREIREAGAIYALAEARIEERDALTFDIEVILPDRRPLRARFTQEFWPNLPEQP